MTTIPAGSLRLSRRGKAVVPNQLQLCTQPPRKIERNLPLQVYLGANDQCELLCTIPSSRHHGTVKSSEDSGQ